MGVADDFAAGRAGLRDSGNVTLALLSSQPLELGSGTKFVENGVAFILGVLDSDLLVAGIGKAQNGITLSGRQCPIEPAALTIKGIVVDLEKVNIEKNRLGEFLQHSVKRAMDVSGLTFDEFVLEANCG